MVFSYAHEQQLVVARIRLRYPELDDINLEGDGAEVAHLSNREQ